MQFADFEAILSAIGKGFNMNNKTTGAIASELLSKHDQSLNPQEVQRAQEHEYLQNLEWAVKHAKKEVGCSDIKGHDECKNRQPLEGSFFISVILKKEKLLENVLRNYFIPTKTCPTPSYDQTLYQYDDHKGTIEFLWVVPDRETSLTFKENALIIAPEERGLLKNVLDFYHGVLFRKMKKFNGEKMSAGVTLENFIEGM